MHFFYTPCISSDKSDIRVLIPGELTSKLYTDQSNDATRSRNFPFPFFLGGGGGGPANLMNSLFANPGIMNMVRFTFIFLLECTTESFAK